MRSLHLLTLDALRGVAALTVVFGHRLPWFEGSGLFERFWLAVDFFLLLSGFVIDRAYRDRIAGGLTFPRFAAIRLIRLYPLVLAGVTLGFLVACLRSVSEKTALGAGDLIAFAGQLLLIPQLWASDLYPLNKPLWSIFFELLSNVAFFFLVPLLTLRRLLAVVAASATFLVVVSVAAGGVDGGFTPATLSAGAARTAAAFSIGCLLNRLNDMNVLPGVRIGLSSLALAFAIFCIPEFAGDVLLELTLVLLVLPALVFAAARSPQVAPRLCRLLGDLSYPLYALHIPLLFLLGAAVRVAGLANEVSPLEGGVRILAVCVIAWTALKLYDEPVRAWLTARLVPPAAPSHGAEEVVRRAA